MKKLLSFVFIILATTSSAKADEVASSENRAVQVRFFGGLTGFDEGAYRAIKSSMASLLVDGMINHFVTTEVGLEGGSEFCVELNNNPDLKIEIVTRILSTIKPSDVTTYSFEEKVSCFNKK